MSRPPVDVNADFAERIAHACGAGARVTSVEPMPGGHSGLTHRVIVTGWSGPEVLVVKSTPPGRAPVGRHDVLRQARIIEALGVSGTVPVPTVFCSDDRDPPFFATDLVPGVAVDPVIDQEETTVSPSDLAARWDAAIDLLGALHQTSLELLGLDDEPSRSPASELSMWEKTMKAAGMEDDASASRLRKALRADVPAAGETSVVHGDFRLGNILFAGTQPQAVIDWEIWSVGDAAVDLGWFAQFTDPRNYPGFGREVPGTPSAEAVLDCYAAVTGRATARPGWFLALGCFKLAAVQAHNRRRHEQGRYTDPWQDRLGPSIARVLDRGLTHLEL